MFASSETAFGTPIHIIKSPHTRLLSFVQLHSHLRVVYPHADLEAQGKAKGSYYIIEARLGGDEGSVVFMAASIACSRVSALFLSY